MKFYKYISICVLSLVGVSALAAQPLGVVSNKTAENFKITKSDLNPSYGSLTVNDSVVYLHNFSLSYSLTAQQTGSHEVTFTSIEKPTNSCTFIISHTKGQPFTYAVNHIEGNVNCAVNEATVPGYERKTLSITSK